jgi:hypothetical protein
MTAHTRTGSFSPSLAPTIALRSSTRSLIVIAASVVLEAIIVLGFVSSSVGLGAAPYPDPDRGWATAPPSAAPAARAVDAVPSTSGASAPEPAPEAAPAPR